MSAVVLDIETVPTEAALAMPYPEADRNPPSNYKNAEAIAGWRERDKATWEAERVKACSLDPRLGRIICVGLSLPCSDGPIEYEIIAATEADEPNLLAKTWDALAQCEGKVVTWNGMFDLRFIVVRSLHHGVTPTLPTDTVRAWFRKYAIAPHFDVKAALTNWEPTNGHLDDWAAFLGVEAKPDGVKGPDVYPMYREGKLREIAAYCRTDVIATRKLYERARVMFA